MSQTFSRLLSNRAFTIEVGKLALQANGAVTVRYGDTVVLVTACVSHEPVGKADFLRMTVNYEEKLYAAGKIPGSFIRREGRPSEEATLTMRLVDRCLRPLIPKDFDHEIQIIATVLSADKESDPDICALVGASAALTISEIPFSGPISAVHVGYLDDKLVINPSLIQVEDSLIDLVVASTKQAIVMVEAGARESSEEIILEAIQFGHEANQEIIKIEEELQQAYGKAKMATSAKGIDPELTNLLLAAVGDKLRQTVDQKGKSQREQVWSLVQEEAIQKLADSFTEEEIIPALEAQFRAQARKKILEERRHLDGRQANEIRPISCEVSLLPRAHGSGLFGRGETQVLTVTTLGSTNREQLLDGLGIEDTKRFMHHYNFAPFSTGEVRRVGAASRREIGHGALVERAIAPVLPSEQDFPYAIRLVSEVLSSSGSTSMASACGSTLSLMDAGVPIKAPVAGIAVGLLSGEDSGHVILTDIEGVEDAYGDMDFKVAGTSRGVTALQLDIKLQGVEPQLLAESLDRARQARLEILEKMQQTIGASRPELSPYAPRMYKISINPEKIGALIGPGGKTIRSIIDETKTTIDVNSDGTVIVGSPDGDAAQKAISRIQDLTREVKSGDIYTGRVTRVLNFGAMVEILPGKEGLVHISELAEHRVPRVEDVVKVGDEIMVKVTEIDNMGRINLSRRAVFEGPSRIPGARTEDSSFSRPRSPKDARYNKGSRQAHHNR